MRKGISQFYYNNNINFFHFVNSIYLQNKEYMISERYATSLDIVLLFNLCTKLLLLFYVEFLI
jgi:hypothetical protein